MPEIHAARRARAQAKLAELEADAVLLTAGPNVRYLTGLASSNAALLLPADGTGLLATDSRYELAALRDAPDLDLTVDRYEQLVAAAEDVSLISFFNRVEELRMVKDPSELELLGTACRITDQAFADVLPLIRPGLSERALAAALDHRMGELGAERPSFDTIVASGPNGALPHHVPSGRPLRRGDLITMDFGAQFAGYHADMTRTVALGEPAAWQRDVYELVAAAQRAGCTAARPGAALREVDAAARDLIAEAGHSDHFGHGLGHGVGLEVHEAPMIGYGSTGKLEDHVSVTVEPGVYLPGQGGVRIEDVLVVGAGAAGGAAQILTTTTKELLAL